jgi:cobalt/nickel transport system ATP-binding protein
LSEELFICRGVSYRYPDGTVALRDIDLVISKGDSIAIVGINGSGKSTLLLLLGALLSPTEGSIEYKGSPLNDYGSFRREVGILFQNPYDQFLTQSVYDEIAYVPRQLGYSEGEVEDIVRGLAEKLGLLGLLDKSPFKVSGGEARRVGIAMTLAYDPETVILDEPFLNLSDNYIRIVKDVIYGLREEGKTVIFSWHSLDNILDVADKMVILYRGSVLGYGDVDTLFMDGELLYSAELEYPVYIKLYYQLGLSDHYPLPHTYDEFVSILTRHLRL